MNIKIGVPVIAEDGEAGWVERLILHPQTRELDALVVGQGDMLMHDVVVPIDRVLAAATDGVRLQGTIEELSELEPFQLSQYTAPPEEWIPPSGDPSSIYLYPVSPVAVGAFIPPAPQVPSEAPLESLHEGDVEVSGSTTVYCGDRGIGHLDRVVTDGDSDRVTHLVIEHRARAVAVPVEQVDAIGDDGIRLALGEEELDHLPTFSEA